ncbi:MAG: TIGR04372 family glycosyltransferase [Candidatus Brocadiaceae bacterium]|nr:TIGR04372 family glycosyltransferase [Candidatus Brocadiaceae bacterium]
MNIKWAVAYYYKGEKLKKKCDLLRKRSKEGEVFHNLSNRAVIYLKKAISIKPEWIEAYEILYALLYTMGKMEEFVNTIENATKLRRELARKYQFDQLGIEFVPGDISVGAIGITFHLDTYIKAGILGLRTAKKTIQLLPQHRRINNPCYVGYWSRYLNTISEPLTIRDLSFLEKYLTIPIHWMLDFNDQAMFFLLAESVVEKQWHKEGRPPLLSLTVEDQDRGWRCLKSLGMPQDAWFVCFHIRESSPDAKIGYGESYRYSDINHYLPAVETILSSGGWVVQMGDSKMTPFPKMDHVIQYAHSEAKSDWMDIFCCAQCRFFLGSPSGLGSVPSSFGVPVVWLNYMPPVALYTLKTRDLFIPKLFRRLGENRFMTFKELLTPPNSMGCSQIHYDDLGIDVVDNTSDEIKDVVAEMIARSNGTQVYTEEDENLQEKFRGLALEIAALYGAEGVGVNARMGQAFLFKHGSLLRDSKAN